MTSYTWIGRELRKIINGSNTYSYKYNADGIRTSKRVGFSPVCLAQRAQK